jgi:hypothetical protein
MSGSWIRFWINFFLGSGSKKIKDSSNPLRIDAYSRIEDDVSKELALGNTKNGLGRVWRNSKFSTSHENFS